MNIFFDNSKFNKNYINIKNYEIFENFIIFDIPDISLSNNDFLIIKICFNNIKSPIQVKFRINGIIYDVVLPICANYLYSDQIFKSKTYMFSYAYDSKLFIYCGGCCLRKTKKCNESSIFSNKACVIEEKLGTFYSNEVISVLLK